MCNNFPNIRITEGNNFSIILPLISRTYVATKPIEEEIDPEQLENVVVTFGGVEYPSQITAQGVQIDLPATLAVAVYDILLTADYLGSSIRAAYESAVTIVQWSAQSTAEQYITGSPIVMRAAYVLSGALTDAELEALKDEYREKNAQLAQAIADAEDAKREWEEKAADLDGVAQESTLTQGVQDIIAAMPSTDGLATEENATENKDDILAAIEAAAMRSFSGHLDEIGLAQIGWGEDDIAWFRKRVDWDASMDEAMKVPQELIDAYNDYKDQHGGVVDSGFYTEHKGQWYFRYAPVVSSYSWAILQNAPYMLACPAAYYQLRADFAFNGSNALRYIPDLKLPSWNNPFGFTDWMRWKTSVYVVNFETYGEKAPTGSSYHQSTFHLIRQISPNANCYFQYPFASVRHLYIEAKSVAFLPSFYNPNCLAGCLSCYIKGLASGIRLVQPYITKKELLFAINNEASDGTTPYVITLSAAMYNLYANDAEVLAALSNHSNFALASA
jgi:hypothetical protein